ncbi:MAG: hypothetical protein AB7O29_06955 [Acidimicrobiia bacterium]
MTATDLRPPPPAEPSGPTEPPHPGFGRPPAEPVPATASALFYAEGALVLLSLVSVLGLARLVDDSAFLGAVLSCTLGAHLLAAVGRRRRWPPWAVGVTGALGVIVVLGLVHVPATTAWGLPTLDTL